MVYIFYMHNVVALFVYSINIIYGGGIHRTRRYSGVHTPLQKNNLETHCSQGIFIIYFTPHSSLKSRTTVFRHFSKNKLSILVRIILLPNSSLKWMKKAQYRQHLCVFETNLSPQYYNCYFYPKFFAKMDE